MEKAGKIGVGFTLLEVVISLIVATATILSSFSLYRSHQVARSSANARSDIMKVEDLLRRSVFRAVESFFWDGINLSPPLPACDASHSFSGRINSTYPPPPSTDPVIALTSVTSGNGASLVSSAPPELQTEVQIVVNRCLSAPNTVADGTYFQTNATIYFCLLLQPMGIADAYQNPILRRQPVIGEFSYSTVNLVEGTAVTCPQFKVFQAAVPPIPTGGILTYTLHWTSSKDTIGGYRELSGLMAMRNYK